MRFVLDANVSLTWFLTEAVAQTASSQRPLNCVRVLTCSRGCLLNYFSNVYIFTSTDEHEQDGNPR